MSYAMASAGVIFSAILQQRTDPKSNWNETFLPPPFDSRPFWMHQLQQFLAALRSIDSNDPHFERCQKALRIFTRVHEVLIGEGTSTTEKHRQIQPHPSDIPFADSQAAIDAGPATVSDAASTDYYTESGHGWRVCGRISEMMIQQR
jgi:hypothetical protein